MLNLHCLMAVCGSSCPLVATSLKAGIYGAVGTQVLGLPIQPVSKYELTAHSMCQRSHV